MALWIGGQVSGDGLQTGPALAKVYHSRREECSAYFKKAALAFERGMLVRLCNGNAFANGRLSCDIEMNITRERTCWLWSLCVRDRLVLK